MDTLEVTDISTVLPLSPAVIPSLGDGVHDTVAVGEIGAGVPWLAAGAQAANGTISDTMSR